MTSFLTVYDLKRTVTALRGAVRSKAINSMDYGFTRCTFLKSGTAVSRLCLYPEPARDSVLTGQRAAPATTGRVGGWRQDSDCCPRAVQEQDTRSLALVTHKNQNVLALPGSAHFYGTRFFNFISIEWHELLVNNYAWNASPSPANKGHQPSRRPATTQVRPLVCAVCMPHAF